ncbi:group II intron reverse transcriptase/maturase [Terrisporobacter vanillatitrophus]|uniref:group II intron reverse transcriptase/maturase n=1 Tax=Terrisporobacter vanillatitrophus TaxID=3058402 RepID=UPI003369B925
MDKLKNVNKVQTTEYSGYRVEVKLETGNKHGVHSVASVLPKVEIENRAKISTNNLLDKILAKDNMYSAMQRVIKNKGSHGVDGKKTDELQDYCKIHWTTMKSKLLDGTYKPSPVRRVEIPKPNGGTRMLGIPTVVDRMIQQAIAQALTFVYEPIFSNSSYGFRPNRSQHQAIKKSLEYINEGYKWVVDMDLEKFFDKVNHDILIDRLSRQIKDKRVLDLIRKYLKSGIMLNGVIVSNEEGTPQGGPLSPLLSNIMLDEVDKELERRGHKFCRFADDCNIYVKSRKAGLRVLNSIKKLIENELKLKINEKKSAVDLVSRRKFLGFSFYFTKGGAQIRIHESSYNKLKSKVIEITNRNKGIDMGWRMLKLNQLMIGWINYFGIAKAKGNIQNIEKWIRRRLRACIWKQWKLPRTKCKNLVKLGMDKYKAYQYSNKRKGYWRISGSPILSKTLTNKYLEEIGYMSISKRYLKVHGT